MLLAVAIGGMGGTLGAATTPQIVAAGKYSQGVCQLRLESISQDRAPQGRNAHTVSMQFQLEFAQGEKRDFTAQLPAGYYLSTGRSPLVGGEVDAGRSLIKATHEGLADGPGGTVSVNNLEVGARRDRIRNVEIEVVLVRVTEWEQKKFDGIGLGASDFLQCGPFEFRVIAEATQLRLNAWAYPQFRAEHEAYRKRMPLRFLGSDYAMQELKLHDPAGRSPTAVAVAGGGAGASVATYTNWRLPAGQTEAAGAGDPDQIAYPVTLSVRLPARFQTETLRFRFEQIPLPAPK